MEVFKIEKKMEFGEGLLKYEALPGELIIYHRKSGYDGSWWYHNGNRLLLKKTIRQVMEDDMISDVDNEKIHRLPDGSGGEWVSLRGLLISGIAPGFEGTTVEQSAWLTYSSLMYKELDKSVIQSLINGINQRFRLKEIVADCYSSKNVSKGSILKYFAEKGAPRMRILDTMTDVELDEFGADMGIVWDDGATDGSHSEFNSPVPMEILGGPVSQAIDFIIKEKKGKALSYLKGKGYYLGEWEE